MNDSASFLTPDNRDLNNYYISCSSTSSEIHPYSEIYPESDNEQPKKKRQTNPLAPNSRDMKCAKISQKKQSYLGFARNPHNKSSVQKARSHQIRSSISKKSLTNYWDKYKSLKEYLPIPENVEELEDENYEVPIELIPILVNENMNNAPLPPNEVEVVVNKRLTFETATDRRHAVKYLFIHKFGSPPEEEWKDIHLVDTIMQRLEIPYNSRSIVVTLLKAILVSVNTGTKHKCDAKRNRKLKIIDHTAEAKVIYHAMESGLSTALTTFLVNTWRASKEIPEPPLSWSAVNNFISRSKIIKRTKRGRKKSGKTDVNCMWSTARLAEVKQFKEMLRLGSLPPDHIDVVNSPFPPLLLHAIAWWDEKHAKVKLGHESKWENRLYRNPFDNQPTEPEFGGVLPPAMPNTSMKFAEEARFLFGVAMRKEGEDMVGIKAEPFSYTGRHVVGVKAYDAAIKAELHRVMSLKGVWNNKGGYHGRYGDRWEAEVKRVVNQKWCCIIELIDHVTAESTNIYRGTEWEHTFLIFHDGLSAWWEAEAQQYITSKGFGRRQLCCYDPTNVGNRYRHKLAGDSPEICRGLDSHGFAYLVLSMSFHCCLSSLYAVGDPRAFRMGTPAQVESTMRRCWQMEPTSECIVKDIKKFPFVIDKIIEAEGCVVPDLFFRTGRRAAKLKGEGFCKNTPISRQRKSTIQYVIRPIHPDCQEAFDSLSRADYGIEIEIEDLDNVVVHENDDERSVNSDSSDDEPDIE